MERLAIEQGQPVRGKPWTFQFHGPDEIGELEKAYVLQALDSRRMFRFMNKREESFPALLEQFYKDRLGISFALAVNGGTSSLICALAAAGVGPGDEVIVPAYTFIATAAAVVAVRAVPVIVECDDTLNMDPAAFRAAITPYTKAVIPVHMRGVMAQMNEIMSIANQYGLVVIEDVAQANGGSYFGKPLGAIGDYGCFSFQHYKVITAGEGGMVVTNSQEGYIRAGHQHDCAFQFWGGDAEVETIPGENYRMSEINGALGLAQAQKLDTILGQLRENKKRIVSGVANIPGLALQRVVDPAGDCGVSFVFYLPDSKAAGTFSKALQAEGIPNGTVDNGGVADRHIYRNWDYILQKRMASPVGTPWNCAEYKGSVSYDPDMCPVTLDYLGRAISIGLHQRMSHEDCDDVIHAIQKVAAVLI
ncbi:DegT/DnrJ/EryC1/StrS aminotransferase family protein [Paenibacillus sp. BC26]|uniref:DegT/DnrJ/EryC1/StrS family aminotransferase n=1 Tax=Paenibacillus sp. BC26 TaxID=1881032 RepID=UPI0008E098C7|nr:aminotransferase class I/II-fold pyridoxal phosphate-dependent enzyme [Paenibacillus sp. BC26]SFT14947.1 8-amino-3,8-dideoxy-alpha-D-manno-octulosonate transaminase [Paenibacillus sp. BC26]